MKTVCNIAAFFLLVHVANAQIGGSLLTAAQQPVPFASVLLLHAADSTLAKGVLTNQLGRYTFENVMPSSYFIRASVMGMKTYNSTVFVIGENQASEMDAVVLEDDAYQLQEVVVHAEKPLYEQATDRTIVNVESSVLTKGSSALQVLERSPGIYVDLQNGNIVMNGKSDVLVMLNGKIMRLPMAQLVAMLNAMSANDIEKIELITTPPAKYDADGNAGMINIVFKKKQAEGTTGSFSMTGGYGWREKANGSINLSHSTKKIVINSAYSFFHDRTQSGWVAGGTQDMPAMGGRLHTDFVNNDNVKADNHQATLGMMLAIPKGTIGASVLHMNSRTQRHISNRAEYTLISDSVLQMQADITGDNHWRNTITTIFIEKQFREGEKLNVDFDYLNYKTENPTHATSRYTDKEGNQASPSGSIFSTRQRGTAKLPIHVGIFKIDYQKELSKKLKQEIGAKLTYTQSANTSVIEHIENDEWISTDRTTSNIDMRENIYAAYTTLSMHAAKAVTVVAGARYEYSRSRLFAGNPEENVDRKLSKLFPSLFISKKINDRSDLQISYTKRISRPSYNDLASYLVYNDPMSVFTGNPALRPTVTNTIKVGYNLDGYSFAIIASRDDHPIVRYQLSENATHDLMYVAPQNMAYQNNLNVQLMLPVKITSWWSMSYGYTGGVRQFMLSHTKEEVSKTYFGMSLNGSQTFSLPQKVTIEVSGWYNGVQFEGSKKVDGFGMLSAGIKKELKNNRGSFQLAVTDVLKSLRITSHFGFVTEEAFDIRSKVVYRAESAHASIVKVTYFKSFGLTKTNTSRSRNANDENERIRKD